MIKVNIDSIPLFTSLELTAFLKNNWVFHAHRPGYYWISNLSIDEARDVLDVDQQYQLAIADDTLEYIRQRNTARRQMQQNVLCPLNF